MHMPGIRARGILVLALGLFAATAPTFSAAQDAEPYFAALRIHTVKADQVAAWESLMRERRDVERAAGRPFRRVFERIRGEQNAFLILQLDSNLDASIPNAPASPSWMARLNETTQSRVMLTVQMYPQLEANLDGWLDDETDLLRVRLRTAAAGRDQDYLDWQAGELLPALTEAGTTIRGGRVFLGGNSRQWVRLSIEDSWDSMMAPNAVFQSRDFQRMYAAGEEMVTASTDLMYRYRADLSFVSE